LHWPVIPHELIAGTLASQAANIGFIRSINTKILDNERKIII